MTTRKILTLALLCAALGVEADATLRETDLQADTWVATDGLGREMPTAKEVGNVKTDKNRTVGIFYITWHDDG